jgi:carbonic anhydrase
MTWVKNFVKYECVVSDFRPLIGVLVVLALLFSGLVFPNRTEAGSRQPSPLIPTGSHDDPYLICEKGTRQSPIDIASTSLHETEGDLIFRYTPTQIHVIHDGHSVQAINEAPSMVIYRGDAYQLLQLHFHEPSEHHIDGISYAMEMHLVHKNSQNQILVVGVLIQLGSENHEIIRAGDWIQRKLGHRSVQEGEDVTGEFMLDVMKLLPQNQSHYFTYEGSLTTAPCTEGVTWVVLKQPIEVSQDQVRRFVRAYGHTAREVQALEGREILSH